MEGKNFNTIDELIKHLTNQNKNKSSSSKILYRGQADSTWELKSTLERYTKCSVFEYSVEQYEQQLAKILPEINALTSNNFSDESSGENETPTEGGKSVYYPRNPDFMAYVRQHGYPTPILDWTESLYIALFFAFQTQSEATNKYVAIYTYVNDKVNDDDSPNEFCELRLKGVNLHKRHFIQQAIYAYSVAKIDNSWFYTSLEDTYDKIFGKVEKFTVPISQKSYALDMLASMTITPYALYDTEDKLLDSLKWKNRKGLELNTTTFMSLAQELADTSSYAETHRIIEQFNTIKNSLSDSFDEADTKKVNYILNSARKNSQILDIRNDPDVTKFLHEIVRSIGSTKLTQKNKILYDSLKEI